MLTDLDGDGYTDLVTANTGTGWVLASRGSAAGLSGQPFFAQNTTVFARRPGRVLDAGRWRSRRRRKPGDRRDDMEPRCVRVAPQRIAASGIPPVHVRLAVVEPGVAGSRRRRPARDHLRRRHGQLPGRAVSLGRSALGPAHGCHQLPRFPKSIPRQVVWSSPAVGDLDANGAPDIVFGTGLNFPDDGHHVYALNNGGYSLPGWSSRRRAGHQRGLIGDGVTRARQPRQR